MKFSQTIQKGTLKISLSGTLTRTEIKAMRKSLGLTQIEASKIFGGGPNAFSRYEKGKTIPSKSTCNLLGLIFNLSKSGESLCVGD